MATLQTKLQMMIVPQQFKKCQWMIGENAELTWTEAGLG